MSTVRSYAFPGVAFSATSPTSILSCPAGHVYLVKQFGAISLTAPSDESLFIYYQRSGAGGLLVATFTSNGPPLPAGFLTSGFFVLNAGDEVLAESTDGSEWDVTMFGADLVNS